MTKDEFIDKYKDVVVRFDHYYKYKFNYKGTLLNGNIIMVSFGGDSSDIYRTTVYHDDEHTVEQLSLVLNSGSVFDEMSREVESFYEY